MPSKLQEKMFYEMEQKDIFRQAQKYAFDVSVHGRLLAMILAVPSALLFQQEIKRFKNATTDKLVGF